MGDKTQRTRCDDHDELIVWLRGVDARLRRMEIAIVALVVAIVVAAALVRGEEQGRILRAAAEPAKLGIVAP